MSAMPPPLPTAWLRGRRRALLVLVALLALVAVSFASLDLQWARFFGPQAMARMGRFAAELLSPNVEPRFLARLWPAMQETVAMSVIGTLLAAVFGLLLAIPAARTHEGDRARWRPATRLLLNALRSVPELMWAALLLVAAGLGPFAGTHGAGAAHDRRARAPVRRGHRERAAAGRASRCACAACARGRCSPMRCCRSCCPSS